MKFVTLYLKLTNNHLSFSTPFLIFLSTFIHTHHLRRCSLSRATPHTFLPLKPVNLNPVLHQFISLRSWAHGEPRDYQRPTSTVVPISAFCHRRFIKIKGFFLPFTCLAFPPLQVPVPVCPRSGCLTDCEKRDSLWHPRALGHDLKELGPQISLWSCISGWLKVQKPSE